MSSSCVKATATSTQMLVVDATVYSYLFLFVFVFFFFSGFSGEFFLPLPISLPAKEVDCSWNLLKM